MAFYLRRIMLFLVFCLLSTAALAVDSSLSAETEQPPLDVTKKHPLAAVNAAKNYQDMLKEQMEHLKKENVDLYNGLKKFQNQFNELAKKIQADFRNKKAKEKAPQPPLEPVGRKKENKLTTHAPSLVSKVIPEGAEKLNYIKDETFVEEKNTPSGALSTITPLTQTQKMLVWMTNLKLAIGLITFSLLVLIWLFWSQRAGFKNGTSPELEEGGAKKQTYSTLLAERGEGPSRIQVNQEGEYDYMGSPESMPVKLDLAKMYITMGDKASARLILNELMEQGSHEQKKKAALLAKKLDKDVSSLPSLKEGEE